MFDTEDWLFRLEFSVSVDNIFWPMNINFAHYIAPKNDKFEADIPGSSLAKKCYYSGNGVTGKLQVYGVN